jgi:hypothetical protein
MFYYLSFLFNFYRVPFVIFLIFLRLFSFIWAFPYEAFAMPPVDPSDPPNSEGYPA